MLVLRDPTWASRIAHQGIRGLVNQRFTEVCAGEAYTYGQHGYMVVVEPGDQVDTLEQETGCSVLHNLFDDARYGNPEFSPSFEALEEHDDCKGNVFYEMLFMILAMDALNILLAGIVAATIAHSTLPVAV